MDQIPEDKLPSDLGLSEEERARIARVSDELAEGIESLADIGTAVSIFGSARSQPDSWEYQETVKLAKRLADEGITVVTGGGPGVMEAGNRGAQMAVGKSVGLNIELPHEQLANPYLDIGLDFRYFFTRKFLLIRYAIGFAIFPGGFGTVDELFELLTLMQTGKLQRRPIVLVGRELSLSLCHLFLPHRLFLLLLFLFLTLFTVFHSFPLVVINSLFQYSFLYF